MQNFDMNSGAYSDRYKVVEREQIDSFKNAQTKDNLARGKKLSQENYRRRRALAIKRKLEAQKEEQRRQQILAKRREKQREATERFQRRNRSRNSSTPDSAQQDVYIDDNQAPALDDALRAIRGSPIHRQTSNESQGPLGQFRAFSPSTSSPYHAFSPGYTSKSDKYAYVSPNHVQQQKNKEQAQQSSAFIEMQARSLRNMSSSRSLFEQNLHQQQQLLVEQQEQSLHDFNAAIMQEMLNDKKIEGVENDHDDNIETDSLSSADSLDKSQDISVANNSRNNRINGTNDDTNSFHLCHDKHDFSLNRQNNDPNRTFEVDEKGEPMSKLDNVLSSMVQTDTVLLNNREKDINLTENVFPNRTGAGDPELASDSDPSIYRTSAFQIHNKAWINSDQGTGNDSNVPTSNYKPNSLRTTATNATVTHPVVKKSNEPTPQPVVIASKPPVPQMNSGTSRYVVVPNGVGSASQLRQPTVYSRIPVKDDVKQESKVKHFNTPSMDQRLEDESIQDDISSINSTTNPKAAEEVKALRGILKPTGGHIPVAGSSKSSGYGTYAAHRTVMQKPNVRDSLEINKKVMDAKHERQDKKKSDRKKGVRFADLVYDDDSSSEDSGEQPKETIYEVEREEVRPIINNPPSRAKDVQSSAVVKNKPPRPISARVTGSIRQVEKPTRIQSAPAIRRSVLPQGRIIQHNTEIGDTSGTPGPPHRRTAFMESPAPSISAPLVRNNGADSRQFNGHDSNLRPTDNRQYVLMNHHNNHNGYPNQDAIVAEDNIERNGVQLDRTPTDAEINWLWDKVRTCLNKESSSVSESSSRPPSGRLYIDGNTINPNQQHITRVAASPTGQKQFNYNADTVSSIKKRNALLQQRNKQQRTNTLKGYRGNETPTAQYTTTVQYPSNSSHGPSHANSSDPQEMSESMAAFLTAETLSKQNVTESQINIAMDNAHKPRHQVGTHGYKPKGTSALSLEEQRLMQSLERLNERLRITDVSPSANMNQPNVFSPKTTVPVGFKGHQPLSAHARRGSADSRRNIQHFRTGSGTGMNRTTYTRQY